MVSFCKLLRYLYLYAAFVTSDVDMHTLKESMIVYRKVKYITSEWLRGPRLSLFQGANDTILINPLLRWSVCHVDSIHTTIYTHRI